MIGFICAGPGRDCAADRHSRCHHGVLVPHQPHRHPADGTVSGMALPCHLPQLLHMERQPWEKGSYRVIVWRPGSCTEGKRKVVIFLLPVHSAFFIYGLLLLKTRFVPYLFEMHVMKRARIPIHMSSSLLVNAYLFLITWMKWNKMHNKTNNCLKRK